ncbi:MAG TPA: endonuclease/exonuclease/phosphatase family protein [Gemmatimonas sp.]|nr:endonuclease/exonuclease/phosphatase family protein [Gemmatimonas sp.]
MEPFWFGTPLQRITVVAAWLYLIGVFASWMLLRYWSEENILATLIAYGPRTVALWPLALLVPAAVFWGRSSLWLLAIAAGIIVFPILGVRVSPGTWNASLPATPAPGTVRILTFNTQSGGALSYDLSILLREFAPDVFTFQECGDQLWAAMEAEKGWFTRRYGSLCTGSRWKIERIDSMPRADLERVQQFGFGGAGFVLRTVVQSPMGRFAVINLHLETARRGLEGMFGREGIVPDSPFPGGQAGVPADDARQAGAVSRLERFRVNTMIRNKESALASRWVTTGIDDMPYLIAGDFNLPVESTIFRAHWGHFVNAFEATGNGLGWTKHEGRWLRIRIDHVLSGERGFMPLFVRAVPDYRSDHRPVVADYKWPGSS